MPPIDDNVRNVTLPGSEQLAAAMTQQYAPGQQVMARGPALNAQYERGVIAANADGTLIVEFADGSRYSIANVDIQGIMQEAPPATSIPLQPPAHNATSLLPANYDAFSQLLVELDARCRSMFAMPLDSFITMVRRNAERNQLTSSGAMDIIGNIPMFVPDTETMRVWVEHWLEAIARQERKNGAE